MLDTFSIKVTRLVKLPQLIIDDNSEEYGDVTDVVTAIHFNYVATKSGYKTEKDGLVAIPFNKESEFVEFSKLSEATVVSWIETLVGEETISSVKEELEARLDTMVPAKLPWE